MFVTAVAATVAPLSCLADTPALCAVAMSNPYHLQLLTVQEAEGKAGQVQGDAKKEESKVNPTG